MAIDDEINVDDLANNIVDTTLDALGGQTDDRQEQELYDIVAINPATYVAGNTYTVVRVAFKTPFAEAPVVTFGQASAPGATNFVILPYIQSWTYANGLVDGFMLGIYTVVAPPPGLSIHYITWHANGTGSRSGQQATEQSWADSYDSEPDFLQSDTSDVDTSDDLLDDPPLDDS